MLARTCFFRACHPDHKDAAADRLDDTLHGSSVPVLHTRTPQPPSVSAVIRGRWPNRASGRQAARLFGGTCNQQWLIERHGYRSPIETRDHPPAKPAR